MNCKKFEIWLISAEENEILNPSSEMLNHADNCTSCKIKFQNLKESLLYMNHQKSMSLGRIQTENLINKLQAIKTGRKDQIFKISKFAAAMVIIIGLLVGITLGGLLFSDQNTETPNNWGSEFTLLSDNSGYDTFLFD
ncbi:MAG: hypothetical protein JXA77_13890 [Bacteroidales bacterium]|nr:hypothetical protein [Bacteroidales bacterium]MBN2819194.1 hypothetical protein [Bacteroidales bacterium]